jgi:hypothetical protein
VETEAEDQYRVVKSRARVYRAATSLKGLYTFNAFLLFFVLVFTSIPTVILLLNFISKDATPALQFFATLGLSFFIPTLLQILVALIFNLLIIFLLALGIRKDWPVITGGISIITAAVHLLSLAFTLFCIFIAFTDDVGAVDSFGQTLVTLQRAATHSMPILVITIIIQTIIALYSFLFLMNGVNGFRESFAHTPLSTYFPNQILVESARKEDGIKMMEMYYASQRSGSPQKSSYELWKPLIKGVDLENEVRVARYDAEVVGFLITSQNFRTVKSVHLDGSAMENEVEKCLIRDFARLYAGKNKYVDYIEVPTNNRRLMNALAQNGWKESKKEISSWRTGFHYVG